MEYSLKPTFGKKIQNISADTLIIPRQFAEDHLPYLHRNVSASVCLINHCGEEWEVFYDRDAHDRYVFTDGWHRFMSENEIQQWDYLLFTVSSRVPECNVKVTIFGDNGLMKYAPSRYAIPESVKVKMEITDDDESHVATPAIETPQNESDTEPDPPCTNQCLKRIIQPSYLKRMPLTKNFVKDSGLDLYEDAVLLNNNGQSWNIKISDWGQSRKPHIVGWSTFARDNNVEVGNQYEIMHVNRNILRAYLVDN